MHPLVDYFRCPEQFATLGTAESLPAEPSFFEFDGAVCYGRHAPAGDTHSLPFDLAEVLDNLRNERYPQAENAVDRISGSAVSRSAYYFVRPILPVGVRKHLQKLRWSGWRRIAFPHWPVDVTVETVMRGAARVALEAGGIRELPFIWFWPDGAPGCVMMTHDVEGAAGAAFCDQLLDLDEDFDIRSAFQVVPDAPWSSNGDTRHLVERLQGRGFEVNVHDLSHDGHLFRSREVFLRRAAEINARGREFGSRGFRSGAMYRRQEWFQHLDFSYDMSVPNVAHLEPQRGGCCTVMPFFMGGVLELPLTTAQDYTLLHVLGDYSTGLWEEQIGLILGQHGLASFIVHPDYVRERRALEVYIKLLRLLVGLREERGIWIAQPSQIDRWWRNRREMTLVKDGESWRVEGRGSDRARVAFARLADGRVVYKVNGAPCDSRTGVPRDSCRARL